MRGTGEGEDLLWKAMANEHRRFLLDLLRNGPRTTGDLAARMDGLSRYAVMQHLEVLVEAGLVLVRRQGRERFNHLNPVPLQQMYERWVSRFAATQAASLTNLKRFVEEGENDDNEEDGHGTRC